MEVHLPLLYNDLAGAFPLLLPFVILRVVYNKADIRLTYITEEQVKQGSTQSNMASGYFWGNWL